jgi:probable F420-dependent oxidoreductase
MVKPFRFGVQTKTASTRTEWVERVKKIESLGYGSISMPDHFDDQLDPALALMVAAEHTTDLRIGALVWCNDYRHPVVFAKEMATLDLLSEGRLELGIGAGWMKSDYDESGITYDRPGVRIDRMLETLDILEGLFADGPFSYEGEHYTITNLEGTPKPVQAPRPPFLVGGGGPRFLKLAGQRADIVGINFNLKAGAIGVELGDDASSERFAEKLSWVQAGAGERFEQIELQVRTFFVNVGNDREADAAGMGEIFNQPPEVFLDSPFALFGTTEQIAETLRQRRDRFGVNYIVIGDDHVDAFAPVVAELAGT